MDEVYRGIWVIAYRELLRFVQERARIVSSLAMPLLFLVIIGAGFSRLIGEIAPGVDFLQFVFPGIIAMTVLMNSVFSGLSVVWDREFGFLREVLVAPLSRTGIVLGKAVGGATVGVLQGLILLLLAPAIGVRLSFLQVLTIIPLLVLLSLTLSGLGILIASRMRSQQAFHLVVQIMVFPLVFLSGIFFPVNNVPFWLEVISKINPLTYGVDAIRQVFLSGSIVLGGDAGQVTTGVTLFGRTVSLAEEVAMMTAFGALLLLAAAWSFGRQE
ncbi:MAG: ABC transporter permease [Dehalococcoidia bacterium]|nr:ABC transporter permease [Dehalococcoidia bacterium]